MLQKVKREKTRLLGVVPPAQQPVESYRTVNGPRQRIVAYLGQLKESTRKGVKRAAEGKDKCEDKSQGNPLAKHGHSRDHRGDCKQVCIGLVVTKDGIPLGYEVFAGNTHDKFRVQSAE